MQGEIDDKNEIDRAHAGLIGVTVYRKRDLVVFAGRYVVANCLAGHSGVCRVGAPLGETAGSYRIVEFRLMEHRPVVIRRARACLVSFLLLLRWWSMASRAVLGGVFRWFLFGCVVVANCRMFP